HHVSRITFHGPTFHASRFTRASLRSLVGSKSLLAHSYRRGSHFDKFVFADELEGLLERQLAKGHKAHRVVCRRSAHVCQFLFLYHVYVQIYVARVFTDDHPFVDLGSRSYKELVAFLEIKKRVSRSWSGPVGDQCAGDSLRDRALPFIPAQEDCVQQARAFCVGEKLAAES